MHELETDINFKMGSLDIRPNTKREFDGYSARNISVLKLDWVLLN